MAKQDDGRFRVVDADNHRRVHFDGATMEEAQAFLQAQSPRPHAEDGHVVPNAVIVPGNLYHAGDGVFLEVEED